MSRFVLKCIKNIEKSEGVGATVRRSIGTSQVKKNQKISFPLIIDIFTQAKKFRSFFDVG